MIKMNGDFPGPSFVWDEDDDIEVIVHNKMPFNSSIHWHGLMMLGTPWSDGAPGATQLPIEPEEIFIYRFKASPSGTHWYHAHSRTTLLDGLYGGIFIRPKEDTPGPWGLISKDKSDIQAMEKASRDPKQVLVSDWTEFKSWNYMEAEEASKFTIFCVDSILLNGKGSIYCPGEEYLVNHTSTYMKWALYPGHVNDKGCFPFMKSTEGPYLSQGRPETIPLHLQKGCVPATGDQEVIHVDPKSRWVSLNFIGAATFKTTVFSIDEHPMWVYEVDGHRVEPQKVDTVKMYAGERYAVMIRLGKEPKDYTIRVADSGLTQVISSFATLRYAGSTGAPSTSKGVFNYGGQNTTAIVTLDRNHLPPFPQLRPAARSDEHYVLHTHRWRSAWQYTLSGGGMWQEDRSAYTPLLYDISQPDAQDENLIIRTRNGSWVDLIIQVGSQPGQPQEFPHMMHKHTGKMWQVGAGEGIWNYTSVDEAIAAEPHRFNLENPNYRDTFITSFDGPSWLVLRYHSINPGPWLFHCHIETHLAGGMAIALLDGVDAWPEIPPEYAPNQKGLVPGQPVPRPGIYLPLPEKRPDHDLSLEDLDIVEQTAEMEMIESYRYSKAWNSVLKKMIGFLETIKSRPGS
ncbi:Putative Gip1 [Penicillium brasilianum]|uniref:Putative Gip1 n=1 Tax=Penicillium brasilianum TaxID=104259 RepID=A0A0F7V8Y4_PENBI|nr:Putative Gip1 [Penicillium brasilianum]